MSLLRMGRFKIISPELLGTLSTQCPILQNQHGQAPSYKPSHPSLFKTGDTGSERTECEFVANGTP